jgi:EmrB/QacA subfamily drug resistance transporter
MIPLREPDRLSGRQRWMLVVACASVALVVAAMAALYSALPSIALDTGASQRQLTWVIDGYTLALACLVLPAGALGDRYGRRAMQLVGLGIFAAASALPLLSVSPVLLITARTLAGVGAALVMPSTLSILTTTFPVHQRTKAVGVWAGVAGIGGVVGILGSGLLLLRWSWLSIFVCLSVASVALMGMAVTVPESRAHTRPRLDPAGSLWVVVTISLFVFGTIEGPDRGWLDPVVIASFTVSLAALSQFVTAEWRSAQPLLDLRYFARRPFGAGAACLTIQFLVIFGLFFILVQWLQLVLGYSAVRSAIAMAPLMIPMVVLSLLSPRMTRRFSLRTLSSCGLGAIGVGLCFFSRIHLGSSYAGTILPMLIVSTGLGMCAAPATMAIVQETPLDKHGVAAAVNDAAREIGAAIGIAIAGSVLAAVYAQRIHPALGYLPQPARQPVSKSLAAALEVARRAGPRGDPLAQFARIGFLHGVDRAVIVLAVLSFAGALLMAVWAPRRQRTIRLVPVTLLGLRQVPGVQRLDVAAHHTPKCACRARGASICTCGGRVRWP